MLNLGAEDCDTRWVPKVALTTWAAHAGGSELAPFSESGHVGRAYFTPWGLGQHRANIEGCRMALGGSDHPKIAVRLSAPIGVAPVVSSAKNG